MTTPTRLLDDVKKDVSLAKLKLCKTLLHEALYNPHNHDLVASLDKEIRRLEAELGARAESDVLPYPQRDGTTDHCTIKSYADLRAHAVRLTDTLLDVYAAARKAPEPATPPAPPKPPERQVHVPEFYRPWMITAIQYAWYGLCAQVGQSYRLPTWICDRLTADSVEPHLGSTKPYHKIFVYRGVKVFEAEAKAREALKAAYTAWDDHLLAQGFDYRGPGPYLPNETGGWTKPGCECTWDSSKVGTNCPTHGYAGVPVSKPVEAPAPEAPTKVVVEAAPAEPEYAPGESISRPGMWMWRRPAASACRTPDILPDVLFDHLNDYIPEQDSANVRRYPTENAARAALILAQLKLKTGETPK